MENSAVLNVRISEQLKQQLEELAKEKDETVSNLVREMLETAVLQGNDSVSGIPPELRQRIRTEAERRRQSEANVIVKALRYAFDNLHVGGLWQW